MRTLQLALCLLSLTFASMHCAFAQNQPGGNLAPDYIARLLRSDSLVRSLDSRVLGDSVNYQSGNVEFSHDDIVLAGLGPDIHVRRTYDVAANANGEYATNSAADWEIEIPRITTKLKLHPIVAVNSFVGAPRALWHGVGANPEARCTGFGSPPGYNANIQWDGVYVMLPGEEIQQVLTRAPENNIKPTLSIAGATNQFNLVTNKNWQITCLSSLKNSEGGEGFLVVSPDGTKYWFDWLVFRGVFSIPNQNNQTEGQLLLTRAEDSSGNSVTYQYSGRNLSKIIASDGREVVLEWIQHQPSALPCTDTSGNACVRDGFDYLDRVIVQPNSPNPRVWDYQYSLATPPPLVSAPNAFWAREGRLRKVVLPDNSAWTFNLDQLWWSISWYSNGGRSNRCQNSAAPDVSATITAPSKIVGTFTFACARYYQPLSQYPNNPILREGMELRRKALSGPGVSAEWSYAFSGRSPGSAPQAEILATIFGPSNSVDRYTVYNSYDNPLDGRVAKSEIFSDRGMTRLLRKEDLTYAPSSGVGYPARIGIAPALIGYAQLKRGRFEQYRPIRTKTITQDGVGFTSNANSYDSFANPVSVTRSNTLGASKTDLIAYNHTFPRWIIGQVAELKDSTSGLVEISNSFDANTGKLTSWKQFGKFRQTFTYYADGSLKTSSDGRDSSSFNTSVTYSSWKRGIPQSIVFADGATRSAIVNDHGWITSVDDESSSRTCYAYDAMGRIKEIIYPSETQAHVCDISKWAKTTIDFSAGHPLAYGVPAGHWRQTTQTGSGRKVLVLDALWRPLVEQTLDLSNVADTHSEVITRYDAQGRVAFRSFPMRTNGTAIYTNTALKGTHTFYDALDRVTQVRQDWEGAGQLTTTTEYLSGFQTRVTNPRGYQTLTTLYQAFDEPSYEFPRGISHPEGAFTEIHRDIYGKATALKRRNVDGSVALTRSYSYNANQELCRLMEPETGATLLGYDGAGNVMWSAAGLSPAAAPGCHASGDNPTINPRKITRTYDSRNRLKTLTLPGDGLGNQSWTYTPDGLPATVTTRNDTAGAQQAINSYIYNRRRLLTRESLNFGTALTWPVDYAYNGNGHLASLTWHGLAVNYAPNALGQPTQAGTYATGVTYHPNGGIKEFTYGNAIRHTLTQNARGLPDTSCDFYGSCGASAFLNDGYDYDQNGNVAAISDGRTGSHGNRTMTYDGLDRLTKVVSGNGTSNPMFGTATYAYDALDNLTRVYVTGGNQARNHYYCYDTATWRLTNVKTGSCGGATVIGLGYDVQGNLTNKSGRTYAFDFGNRLRSNSGSPASTYAYDGHGRRVLDQVGTGKKYTHYLQDGRLSMTGDERLGKVAEYIYLQGSLVAIRERDVATNVYTTKYQHTDALGSPVAITNQGRTELERTDYEPYGRPANRAWRDGPGYTGHVEDAATQLNYMQQRYYDPQLGLFLSVDPVTAYGGNLRHFGRYTYAYNNPYSFTDPDGRAPNQAGVTGPLHVYNALQNGSLANLRDAHGGNTNRYFYTERFGWVDIRHFAEAARMVSEGTSGSTVRALGFGNEVHQWAAEWGDDYRSGFSPEDLPSNDAGIDFAEGLREGESLASGFFRWAKNNGAAIDPMSPGTGYENLPATDPSSNGGANRGNSNTTSDPAGREMPFVREGQNDSMRLSREDRNK